MKTDQSIIVRRSAYEPPAFLIDDVELCFELDLRATLVQARLRVRRNPAVPQPDLPLLLNGDGLELVDLSLDDQPLAQTRYQLTPDSLSIANVPDAFTLTTRVRVDPTANTTLNGLYASNRNLYTQCEAEGFRRITWFPDRPDVMSRYTVTLRAEKSRFPVLLSNGNLISQADIVDRPGWHEARWEDPFAKPSYLFALVAGNLVVSERTVKTASGKPRLLQIWVEPGNESKTAHAMQSLVHAIAWDETRFGLELDLERFMVVAVSDFNMGAMENKGLNIFNTKYVFANPVIATDADFAGVESVVGHEYFHNWTGNRVTCRDWFQLTLKEGLTVFRDQEFSADMLARQADGEAAAMSARAVKRIEDVRLLRTAQFAEDAGPMAHPIRPDSYAEINNFYTVTVYEKGAEVIRMLHTLVGEAGFRRGMDLYFERHDGQAVTCDDFLAAIADANGRDFTQFARWYSQAGTPRLTIRLTHDAALATCTLQVSQHCPPTPGQAHKEAFHLPLTIALLDRDGHALPLVAHAPAGDDAARPGPLTAPLERVLEVRRDTEQFVFRNIPDKPVPSLLRRFSAPVILDFDYTAEDLAFLARHDTDPFSRWEAIQRLAVTAVLGVLDGQEPAIAGSALAGVVADVLANHQLDAAYKAVALTMPAEGYIAEQITQVDPVAVRRARTAMRRWLASGLEDEFVACFEASCRPEPYAPDSASAGLRALKNLALTYLVDTGDSTFEALAAEQVEHADNMTDRAAALTALVNSPSALREPALARFAQMFRDEPLALDKWFSMQATMHRQDGDPPVLARVRGLLGHEAYSKTNPNRIRSLVGAFCSGNLAEFHAEDGSGYQFWLEQVRELDVINPQVAARLARAMDRWRKFDAPRQQRMRDVLQSLADGQPLSRDVSEIIAKALGTSQADD